MTEFLLLGPVVVRGRDGPIPLGPRRQERLLLGLLLLEAGHSVPAERLVDLLWEGDVPRHPFRTLQTHVSRLRGCLDPRRDGGRGIRIEASGEGFVAVVDRSTVDVHRFRQQVDSAEGLTDLEAKALMLREALALWRGPLLSDVATDRLRDRIGAGLAELRWQALESLFEAQLAAGHHRHVVAELMDLIAAAPLRERLVAALMLALYRADRRVDALELYRDTRSRLVDVFGVEPGVPLQRLHHRILSDDPSVQLAGPRPATGKIVPRALPRVGPAFVGRRDALARLDELTRRDTGRTVVITGIAGGGGVGKTSLAVHWARRAKDRYPDGQLYVNLRGYDTSGPLGPQSALVVLLSSLAVPLKEIPFDLDAAANLFRSILAQRRVLVLLDNARDAAQVRPLLAGDGGSTILITSRDSLTGLAARDGAQILPLDVLDTSESLELLAVMTGRDRVAQAPAAAETIADACGHLPLALTIIGARIALSSTVSLPAFAAELTGGTDRLAVFADADPAADLRYVFSWSYRVLKPGAARLFRLIGIHFGPDISRAATASLAGVSQQEVDRLLAELISAHLVVEHVPGRYTMHDLVRAYAAEVSHRDDSNDARAEAIHRVLDHYLHLVGASARLLNPHRPQLPTPPPVHTPDVDPPVDHDSALARLSAEHAVLVAAIQSPEWTIFDTHRNRIALQLVDYLDRGGHWRDWIRTNLAAIAAAQRTSDRPAQADAHRSLARAYVRTREHRAADLHYRSALELYTDLGDLTGEAHTHQGMATLSEIQERWTDAIEHASYALALYTTLGRETGQASALNSLGWFYAHSGDHDQAIKHCREALAIQQRAGERRAEALTWSSLGFAHQQAGDWEEALSCYETALSMLRRLGYRHYEAQTLASIGDTRALSGSPELAPAAYHEALAILDEIDLHQAAAVRVKLTMLAG